MKNLKLLNTILLVSGFIAAGIGGAILFVPVGFHALNSIELGSNISLLSEVRAPGGALLACGLLIMGGAFIDRLRFTAIVLAALLYLSYGLSRILSMALDGMPGPNLMQATILELILGLVCAWALLKFGNAVSIRQTN